ncbi:hypothetical protein JGS39_03245 [Streptomyces sp. P01-B04]|uniref:hypothetical protein n=1 Tax=Streptomyces poriferorum TaxID=2798799 RepID=UPI001C60066F|nr:hypothetical protein [Streptomyces poriferorum]MBW5248050.1 hypothetical protein [Streptomyces poriferorum]MBW5255866.1 hypothetical protein [Streptomyces poriferorum]
MKPGSGTTTDVVTDETDVATDETDVEGAEAGEAGVPGTAERARDDDTGAGAGAGADAGAGAGAPGGEETEAGPARRWPRVLAGVLAVVLLAAGGAFYVAGRQLRDTPATSNKALTDSAATTQVAGDVTNALGKVFSYGPGDTAATKASAQQLLAGKALQQYAALFGQVEKQAADQKLTLTTHVVRAGVTRLTHDSAHLLVFMDQVYERKGKAASTAAAQLSVTARLRQGRWTIVEIDAR